MITRFWHVRDVDLIAFIDGELSERKHARVERHLKTCSACSVRRVHIEEAVSEFLDAPSNPVHGSLESPAAAAAALRARLSEAASQSDFQLSRLKTVLGSVIPATATFVFLLVTYLALQQANAQTTPDAELTPGVTRIAQKEEVCSAPSEEQFYPIPTSVAYRVFETYGIRDPEPRTYEVDYLITPALGGADDIRNLWPQPYGAHEWNAHVKDALEDHLYNLVCSGQVALEKAQRDIATNWIAAYKRYFRTEEPLAAHRTFLKDPPWPHEITYGK